MRNYLKSLNPADHTTLLARSFLKRWGSVMCNKPTQAEEWKHLGSGSAQSLFNHVIFNRVALVSRFWPRGGGKSTLPLLFWFCLLQSHQRARIRSLTAPLFTHADAGGGWNKPNTLVLHLGSEMKNVWFNWIIRKAGGHVSLLSHYR